MIDVVDLSLPTARRLKELLAREAAKVKTRRPRENYEAPAQGITFRNDSGETIPRHSVVRITGTVLVGNRVVYTVAKPDQDNRHPSSNLAISGTRDVSDGQYGRCTMAWPAKVAYAGTAPVFGKLCGSAASTFTVADSKVGFIALETGADGYVWVQPCSLVLKGKTNLAHAKSDSGTIDIWTGTGAGSAASPAVSLSAYNLFGALAITKYAAVGWNGDDWDLIAGEC